MHASGWEQQLIHPCNPPRYDLWVNLHFFTICTVGYVVDKHCFLPVLLVFVMKCCIKMPCSLPRNHYCCSLPSPACFPHPLIFGCLFTKLQSPTGQRPELKKVFPFRKKQATRRSAWAREIWRKNFELDAAFYCVQMCQEFGQLSAFHDHKSVIYISFPQAWRFCKGF